MKTTNNNILRGVLSSDYSVEIHDYQNCVGCQCSGKSMSFIEWQGLLINLKNEFGDNLIKVHNSDDTIKMSDVVTNPDGTLKSFKFKSELTVFEEGDIISGTFTVYLRKPYPNI